MGKISSYWSSKYIFFVSTLFISNICASIYHTLIMSDILYITLIAKNNNCNIKLIYLQNWTKVF